MITYSIVQKMAKIGALVTLSVVMSSVVLPLHVAFAATVSGGTGSAGACTPSTKGCDYVALTTIPGATVANQVTDPVKVIKNAYGVAIGIAAVLAVVMIIYAGIEYATVESISGHSDAKDRIMGALVGMGLLLASYIILRTINIDLVNVNLDLGTPIISDSKVKSDVLLNIYEQSQEASYKAIAENQSSKKNLEGSQTKLKSLDPLKKQRDTWLEELHSLDPNDPANNDTITVLNEKINDAVNQINKATLDVENADKAYKASIINASSAKGFESITKILLTEQNITDKDLETARAIQKSNNEAANRELDSLIASKASKPVIAKAEAAIVMNDALSSLSIGVANNIMYLNKTDDFNSKQVIIEARKLILRNVIKEETNLKAKDEATAVKYREQALAQIKYFDTEAAKKIKCVNPSGGITVTETSVSCK